MRILVCGSRNFGNPSIIGKPKEVFLKEYKFIYYTLDQVRDEFITQDLFLMTGGANGVDMVAINWAESKGLDWKVYPADWERWGKSAGPIRNKQMLDDGRPDLVIAFSGGHGTNNMIDQAKAAGITVRKISYTAS